VINFISQTNVILALVCGHPDSALSEIYIYKWVVLAIVEAFGTAFLGNMSVTLNVPCSALRSHVKTVKA